MFKNKFILFLLGKQVCFVFVFIISGLVTSAQSNSMNKDSTNSHAIGFSSLFKVKSLNSQDARFQFELNPKAVSFIQTYMEKQGPELVKMKSWARPYFNLYDAILQAHGIPVELKYLSVIESHLSADLTSWAGAVGPWQIMPDEATRLGLKLTPTDERTDYYKSTNAAATILQELYTEFGDWLLVVAAYNGGAGRLRQVIKKKGTKDFWQLQYELPLETRNHVKKFIATHYVFELAEANNLDAMQVIIPGESLNKGTSVLLNDQLQTYTLSGRFRIAIIAQYLNLDITALSALNPGFDKIVASGKSYALKIPKDRVEIIEAHKNDILQASIQSLYKIKE